MRDTMSRKASVYMRPSEALQIIKNKEDHSAAEIKKATEVLMASGMGKDIAKLKAAKGADVKKNKKKEGMTVVIAMGSPKGKGKACMAEGGMANGKKHMYACGGMAHDKRKKK